MKKVYVIVRISQINGMDISQTIGLTGYAYAEKAWAQNQCDILQQQEDEETGFDLFEVRPLEFVDFPPK